MVSISRPVLLFWLASQVSGFSASSKRFRHANTRKLPMSSNDSEEDGESSTDAMRRMLEGSWNSDIMGLLPSEPEDAANEAGGSLLTAKERGHNLVMVSLLLPSYDITMGSNLYNEVDAVNFCVALSKFLKGKASIVVRDNKTVSAVSRVLEAREAAAVTEKYKYEEVKDILIEEEEEDEDEDLEEVDVDDGDDEDKPIKADDANSADLDDFRKQLMADWGDIKEDEATDERQSAPNEAKSSAPADAPDESAYRLTSMFGDATFKTGPDMFDSVIKAVSANAQPKEDEDTIIILSAASEEETIGVRALVAKYQQSKTILLVNCKFEPVPRELMKAETIYYLLPLVAKPKEAEASSTETEGTLDQPKVVVLRRYPRDFEVYMDFGKGFELTETAGTDQVGRTGPSLEWLAERVKKQMDARSL